MSLKARIEAVLFLTTQPLAAAAVAQLVNADVQEVRQALLDLIHDYELRNCALEVSDDGGYMLQVKDEYSNFANDMAPVDLAVSVVRTLSAIAIKQPIMQSEIVRIRGAGAYDHIKELIEKDLISKKEEGRSPTLSTTKKFQEYFRLSQDARKLRDHLKEQSQPAEGEGGEVAIQLPIEASDLAILGNGLDPVGAPASPTDPADEQAQTNLAITENENIAADVAESTEDNLIKNIAADVAESKEDKAAASRGEDLYSPDPVSTEDSEEINSFTASDDDMVTPPNSAQLAPSNL